MRVSDDMRQCVAYLGWHTEEYHASGTGFFAVHRCEGTDRYQLYLITCRHVAEKAQERSKDAGVYVRLNERGGTATWMRTNFQDWEFHEDDKIDVAILPLDWTDIRFSSLSHKCIPVEWFLSDTEISRIGLGPGNELYFPGLFSRHAGNEANIPILRVGTLAAMPNELVRTKIGLARIHLAEMRSIGGHSGSPVFVNLDDLGDWWQFKLMQEAVGGNEGKETRAQLLGMVHGYFPIARDGFVATMPTGLSSEDFNSGIAAIVPARDILHVFAQPGPVSYRKKLAERAILWASGPTVET